MSNIKIALSIPKSLFEQVDDLARKMKISRSHIFELALRDYLHRQQNPELLAQINTAYANEPDLAEQMLRHKSRYQHRSIVRGEW